MKHPTLIIIQNLRKNELIYKQSMIPSGLVSLDAAEKALQDLEAKLIEFYENTTLETELLTKTP